jgi:hypothetical protein
MKRTIVFAVLTATLLQPALAMNHKKPSKNALRKHQHRLNNDLRKAIEQGGINKIEYLLEAGANPNMKFKGGTTPLHLAAQGRYNACSLLLKYGADLEAQDDHGITPLLYATHNETDEICKLLLDHNAQINAQTYHGSTALIYATSYFCGNLFVRKLLLTYGADLRIKDRHDRTALSLSIPFFNESRILIANSRFYPHYSPGELHSAQKRTRTRLSIMKKLCPTLPKEIKERILQLNSETWQDACCTPLIMHTKKNDRIILMPLPILRLFLNKAILQNKAFDFEQIVTQLAHYKMEQLTPLMLHALKKCLTSNSATRDLREMLDPTLLEEQFGDEIRDNIRAELQPEHSEWFSKCDIQ